MSRNHLCFAKRLKTKERALERNQGPLTQHSKVYCVFITKCRTGQNHYQVISPRGPGIPRLVFQFCQTVTAFLTSVSTSPPRAPRTSNFAQGCSSERSSAASRQVSARTPQSGVRQAPVSRQPHAGQKLCVLRSHQFKSPREHLGRGLPEAPPWCCRLPVTRMSDLR